MTIGAPLAGVPSGDDVADTRALDAEDRGLHTAVPGAVLVDPPALQGPPCAAAGSLCRADVVTSTLADRSA